jgi:hypothetical protein
MLVHMIFTRIHRQVAVELLAIDRAPALTAGVVAERGVEPRTSGL